MIRNVMLFFLVLFLVLIVGCSNDASIEMCNQICIDDDAFTTEFFKTSEGDICCCYFGEFEEIENIECHKIQ